MRTRHAIDAVGEAEDAPVMLPGAPPFQEVADVATARTLANRLAKSDLPIVVAGEVGTGRRTLASALAAKRITGEDLGFANALVVKALTDAVDEFRMAYVEKVLAHFEGNRSQAARALGIDPRTIFRYLAKAKADET